MAEFLVKFGSPSSAVKASIGPSESSSAACCSASRTVRREELKGDDEGIYIGWGCLGDDSAFFVTAEDVKSWWKEYGIPKEIKLRASNEDERADEPRDGWFALYEFFLMIGMKFPLPRLGSEVPRHFKIVIGQLMPNSMNSMLQVTAIRERLKMDLDIEDYQPLYYRTLGRLAAVCL
ncbi:hypothetical protein L484_004716 [Morus notabilis]|uniref:Uncharacterized protein n=1 Tax=Morus notabilis TaxID=981085 RepID=W9S0H9_9ROSA|nr:hypothetical protein L484_004716 [Morus notabilis]